MSERVYPTYNNFNDIEERRSAARCVKHRYGRESVTAMLQNLCWEELLQRRIRAQVLMLYKINKALFCITAASQSRARGAYRLEHPTTRYHHQSTTSVQVCSRSGDPGLQ